MQQPPDRRQPFVSVIVPVHNGARTVPALCDALLSQTYPRDGCEFLLVDDGSTDGAMDQAWLPPGFRVLRQTRGGSYSARNTGVASAAGGILAFTDADCRPRPNWLAAGVAMLLRGEADLLGGAVNMECQDPGRVVQLYDCAMNIPQAYFVQHIGFAATANLFTRREVFEAVGGFDGGLRSGGDQKFCEAAAARGHRAHYCPEAIVDHWTRDSITALLHKTVRVARGRADAFPRPTYYLPRLLALMPPERFDWRRHRMSWSMRAGFVGLHHLLEAVRISAYARRRIEILLRGRHHTATEGKIA